MRAGVLERMITDIRDPVGVRTKKKIEERWDEREYIAFRFGVN